VSTSEFTRPGTFVGTYQYAAPEQLLGEAVSPATDVYALACVTFEALSGSQLYPREGAAAVIAGHLLADIPSIRSLRDELPEAVDRVLLRGLAKEPGNRFQSAGEFGRAMDEALASSTPAQDKAELEPSVARSGETRVEGVTRAPSRVGLSRTTPLVGRSEESGRLRRALAEAVGGRPTVTLVLGEPGIGKSRLVGELADSAPGEGASVLWGECAPFAGVDIPYSAVASALRGVDSPLLESALAEMDPRAARELANVFPDIIGPGGEDPAASVPQARVFGWMLALLRALTRSRPVLLVLEDIHWADLSTRDFLQFLVHNMRAERLAVVATMRPSAERGETSLRRMVVDMRRDERVIRIDLQPLSKECVGRQVAALLEKRPSADLIETLFARAEGNPFYTEMLLEAGEGAAGALPQTVRDALLVPIEELSADSLELVRACAVVGRPVEHGLLGAMVGMERRELVAASREAVDGGVLVSDRATGQFGFRHALMREAVYGDLTAAEAAALHGEIAAVLGSYDEQPNPAEIGRHWEAAGDLLSALRAYFEAGRLTSAVSAYADALDQFDRALALWDRAGVARGDSAFDRIDILTGAAEAARWTGDFKRAFELCTEALDTVDERTDPARAALLYERLGRYQPWSIEASRAAYARALELLPDAATPERARLLIDDALASNWDWRWRAAAEPAEAALQIALRMGLHAEEGSARAVLGVAAANLGDSQRGEAELRRALELVRDGSIEAVATVQLDLADVLRLRGRTDQALQIMVEGERAAALRGADAYARFMAISAADDLFTLGRWNEIDKVLDAVVDDKLSLTARLLSRLVRARLATGTNDLDRGRQLLDEAMGLVTPDSAASFLVVLHASMAELELWCGRPHEAQAAISRGLDVIQDRADALYAPGLLATGVRVEADLAEAARAAGESAEDDGAVARAAALITRLTEIAARASEPASLPIVDANLVLATAERGRVDGMSSVRAWLDAGRMWEKLAHSPIVAYAKLKEAEARLGSDVDQAAGADTLRHAYSMATGLGVETIAEQARRLAREADVKLSTALVHSSKRDIDIQTQL
jgi:tetratricopeptide (TPR) repeat protein